MHLADTSWRAEDYLGTSDPTSDLEDHWAPPPLQRAVPEVGPFIGDNDSMERDVPKTSVGQITHHLPIGEVQAPPLGEDTEFANFDDFAVITNDAADWYEHGDPDLPFFDRAAIAAPVLDDVFAERHTWRVGTRAGILALATAIPHRHGRELAARFFEEALAEARWPGFFRAWLRLAPALDCPRVIALTIELKEHWDDSPHLWRFRDAPGRPSRQHESARGQLGWRRALAMAEAKTHEPVWRILDEDLMVDWEELGEPCPGFWSLAEWLEVMCCGDEAEVHSLGLVVAQGRSHRALHLQEMCERLGVGRTGDARASKTMPMVDQDVATYPFREGYFRPSAGVTLIERRAPTDDEMRLREVE